jgi:hypothetical protein
VRAKPDQPQLRKAGEPGEPIEKVWRFTREGAVPLAVLEYADDVRARVGVGPMAGALANQQGSLDGLELATISSERTRLGTLLEVQGKRNDGAVFNYSYLLQRRDGAWRIVYDSFLSFSMNSYLTSGTRGGQGPDLAPLEAFRSALFDERGRPRPQE